MYVRDLQFCFQNKTVDTSHTFGMAVHLQRLIIINMRILCRHGENRACIILGNYIQFQTTLLHLVIARDEVTKQSRKPVWIATPCGLARTGNVYLYILPYFIQLRKASATAKSNGVVIFIFCRSPSQICTCPPWAS